MSSDGDHSLWLSKSRTLIFCAFILWTRIFQHQANANTAETSSESNPYATIAGNFPAAEDSPDFRSAMADLMNHIQDLPVVKEKVPPLVLDDTGRAKVVVHASIVVASVLAVDDVQQLMKTAGLVLLRWYDQALTWNPSNFSGIQAVELPHGAIWSPSLFYANSPVSENILSKPGAVLIVTYQGLVIFRTTFIAETLCDLDLTLYPFDEQACPLTIVSSSKFVEWQVNQDSYGTELAASHAVASEWDLLSSNAGAFYTEQYDEGGAMVTIKMKRKTTFYAVCLVLPMALTSYMNTLVFLLPLQSGEKVSFIVTIFVSTSVFVSFFTSVMPRGLDSVPNTMRLLVGVIVESLVVLLLTIVVLRRFHQQAKNIQESFQNSKSPAGKKQTNAERSPESEWASNWTEEPPRDRLQNRSFHKVRVAPAPDHQTTGRNLDTDQDYIPFGPAAPTTQSRPTAEQLDHVFFALTFLGNTVFLAVLFSQSLSL